MKRFLAVIGLGLGLVAWGGGAPSLAQEAPVTGVNSSGNCVTTGTPGNWTISCGDINYVPGQALTVLPTVDTSYATGDSGVTPAPAPEPAAAPAPAAEPAPEPADETAPAESAVATETDQDADNYPDALEAELGLDPGNPDTDGDGVADGDELNIYSTDPTVWDTDGDGVSDGEELFALFTDPLVWDDLAAASDEPAASDEAAVGAAVTTDAAPDDSAPDSDSDRLPDADEAALGTDPANPDTDGDGYYDGDEARLGTDPHDATSFPTE